MRQAKVLLQVRWSMATERGRETSGLGKDSTGSPVAQRVPLKNLRVRLARRSGRVTVTRTCSTNGSGVQ
jgi:hypothetical protein